MANDYPISEDLPTGVQKRIGLGILFDWNTELPIAPEKTRLVAGRLAQLIERIAKLEAENAETKQNYQTLLDDAVAMREQLRVMRGPVSHDEVIAVQVSSGHSLQAMTYAAICSMVLAVRVRKASEHTA